MLRSFTIWSTSLLSLLASSGFSTTSAVGATLPFNANYNILATANALSPTVRQISITGSSTNAPYGLTLASSLVYNETDFTTGNWHFQR